MKPAIDRPLTDSQLQVPVGLVKCAYCGESCARACAAPASRQSTRIAPFEANGDRSRLYPYFANRETHPYKINSSGERTSVNWDLAMREFTGRFKEIGWRYGKESIAIVVPGQLSLEELGFLHALTENGMGIGRCEFPHLEPLQAAFDQFEKRCGPRSPVSRFEDLKTADVVLLVNMNSAASYPEVWSRIRNRLQFAEVICLDSCATDDHDGATLSLQLAPGTESALLLALASELDRLEDESTPLESTASGPDSLSAVLQQAGVVRVQFDRLIQTLRHCRSLSLWCPAVDRESCSEELGNTLGRLADVLRSRWGVQSRENLLVSPCTAAGMLMVHRLMHAADGRNTAQSRFQFCPGPFSFWEETRLRIESGEIKGLWIIGTDQTGNFPLTELTPKVRDSLEFVVVQDQCMGPERSLFQRDADLFLPTAGWGEKGGTFMTSENILTAGQQSFDPPGQAISDFCILKLVARYWGCAEKFECWESLELAYETLARLSKDSPWDFAHISYADLQRAREGISLNCDNGASCPS